MLELLRACALYKLPAPLAEFAQACLYGQLPGSPPQLALQAFSVCTGSAVADDATYQPIREASTYILLRSAHVLCEGMEPTVAGKILEKAVQTVEHGVFHPRAAAPDRAVPSRRDAGPAEKP